MGQLGGVDVISRAGNGVEGLTTIDREAGRRLSRRSDAWLEWFSGRRILDRQLPTHIVFVTAYDQHAIEAFEVNAVDYLLKPVDPVRLERAVERAQRRVASARSLEPGGGTINHQLEKVFDLVAERQHRRERLAIKVGERFVLVQSEDIIYASLAEEAITVVTSHHVGTSNYRTLDDLHERLDPNVFWRVHRSHLVNMNKIREIVPWFRNYILRMKDDKSTEIPVSRAHTRRIREYLEL